jgi:hypothetical protein
MKLKAISSLTIASVESTATTHRRLAAGYQWTVVFEAHVSVAATGFSDAITVANVYRNTLLVADFTSVDSSLTVVSVYFTNEKPEHTSTGGLGGGVIAAIVISVVCFCCCCVGCMCKRRTKGGGGSAQNNPNYRSAAQARRWRNEHGNDGASDSAIELGAPSGRAGDVARLPTSGQVQTSASPMLVTVIGVHLPP